MQKTLVAAAAAALMGVAGAANAADVYAPTSLKDTPYAVAPSWTGFHIGLGVGGEAVDHKLSAFDVSFDGISSTGVVGTVEIGYDRQFGAFVGGLFFNYDFGDNVATTLNVPGFSARVDQNGAWAAGGRFGYLVNPSTLAYGLAG